MKQQNKFSSVVELVKETENDEDKETGLYGNK
jgi:hypothetical protein